MIAYAPSNKGPKRALFVLQLCRISALLPPCFLRGFDMHTTELQTTRADEAFFLPAAGFFADESVGVGHVQLPDDFGSLAPELQLGVLAGWCAGIEACKSRALVALFRSRCADDALPLPQRLAKFYAYCKARAIEVPSDFVVALQRY
jgi:hypothetical protein